MQRAVFVLMLGIACTLSAAGAAAANDPFSVSGVPVDATAASSAVARNIAIDSGRARAWTMLFRRLTRTQDWARQPPLDDLTLQRMIRNYMVSNERRSTTRFVADVTYVFNADAVRHLLRAQSIPYIDMEPKPILVVAMAAGYSPRSAWSSLWANPKFANGIVPLVPPIGDTFDVQALGKLNFATAQWQDVEATASRVRAAEAFLVLALPGKGNITVALRYLGPAMSASVPNVVVSVRRGQSGAQAYGAAADAAAVAIVNAWKERTVIDFGKHLKLIADVRIASPSDWGMIMQRLSAIPTVADVSVLAMDSGEARIAIAYVGSPEQLADFAAQSDLSLSNNAGTWQLAIQTPVSTPMSVPQ